MSPDEAIAKIIDEAGGIIAAVSTAIAIRWAAKRWPIPSEDGDPPRLRPGRRRRRHDDPQDDPLPEED